MVSMIVKNRITAYTRVRKETLPEKRIEISIRLNKFKQYVKQPPIYSYSLLYLDMLRRHISINVTFSQRLRIFMVCWLRSCLASRSDSIFEDAVGGTVWNASDTFNDNLIKKVLLMSNAYFKVRKHRTPCYKNGTQFSVYICNMCGQTLAYPPTSASC